VRDTILALLAELERVHGVRVLHACESGSRAWGFASTDSDYDVRFLYLRPRAWYVRVHEAPTTGRDSVIEHMSDDRVLDAAGWDLRKALALLHKSNPPLFEHLHSPINYRTSAEADELRRLAERYYSPARCLGHYLHMAQGNFDAYLSGEEVPTKKYLYVLRPVLACRWIEHGRGVTPVEFAHLLAHELPRERAPLAREVDDLLARKRAGQELDLGPRLPALHSFLEDELRRLAAIFRAQKAEEIDIAPLDEFFRRTAGF
jgi:predicted nucleotidyltransferase